MNHSISPTVAPISTQKIQATCRAQAFLGYAYGFHQPIVTYRLLIPKVEEARLISLDQLLAGELGTLSDALPGSSLDPIVSRLLVWPRAILEKATHPVFEPARLLYRQEGSPPQYAIAQPCLNPAAAQITIGFLVGAMNALLSEGQEPTATCMGDIRSKLSAVLKELSRSALRGFNQLHFLKAAFELGVPWTPLGKNVFQLGFGARARWLDSSFTDATPNISADIALNKMRASSLLRISGLPVPPHALVSNEEDAVRQAEALSYPVVVKPADLDGGKGVKAGLRTADSVRKAFAEASKFSHLILVEKHVPGRDYRLQVVNGTVHGVLDRIPGGITGNGQETVKLLLERQNHERQVATDDRRYLHQMTFDDEAQEQLHAQGMNWNTVPAAGLFVRLRGASNVASGGIPVPVPPDEVHPDNLALAIRAARILRLDVAGIDLLIPDIKCSWLESGAHICEVNAKPQMFTTMHKPMLISLLNGGNGRIPVAIIISRKSPLLDIGTMMYRKLIAAGSNAGLVAGNDVWAGTECINRNCQGAFAGSQMLHHDPAVESMVICVTDDEIMTRGWPVDQCEAIFITKGSADDHLAGGRYSVTEWMNFAAGLSAGLVILDAEAAKAAAPVPPEVNKSAILCMEDGEVNEALARVLAVMLPATARQ